MLQIVASLIDAARGVIYDRHMFIVQATACFAAVVTENVFINRHLFALKFLEVGGLTYLVDVNHDPASSGHQLPVKK